MSDITAEFINDRDLARMLGLSTGWVRVQRHYRRHGREHVLTLDPVMIGASPRYRREDVDGFIAQLKAGPPGLN